jgi:circadian clock protein KaiB
MEGHANGKEGHFLRMRLFVAGNHPNSRLARETLERIWQEYLRERCVLEVVDVLEDFRPALEENVLVAPTLVIYEASSQIRLVGSLSEPSRLLNLLGMQGEAKRA